LSSFVISKEYAEQYQQMYRVAEYGIHGHKWADKADQFLHSVGAASVLDYGAGQGTLSRELRNRGYEVTEFEPGIPEKATLPEQDFDTVVTTDALEHVEPELVDNVLDYIKGHSGSLFAVIATRTAVRRLPDGTNPHRTVKPGDWWVKQLENRWNTVLVKSDNGKELWVEAS